MQYLSRPNSPLARLSITTSYNCSPSSIPGAIPSMQISPVFQSFIVSILQVAIPVIVTPLVGILIGVAFQYYKKIKGALSADQLTQITFWIGVLVKAAEQSGLKLDILKTGAEKKAWVIAQLQAYLDAKGWTGISIEQISALIEAAVRDGVQKGPTGLIQGESLAVLKPYAYDQSAYQATLKP